MCKVILQYNNLCMCVCVCVWRSDCMHTWHKRAIIGSATRNIHYGFLGRIGQPINVPVPPLPHLFPQGMQDRCRCNGIVCVCMCRVCVRDIYEFSGCVYQNNIYWHISTCLRSAFAAYNAVFKCNWMPFSKHFDDNVVCVMIGRQEYPKGSRFGVFEMDVTLGRLLKTNDSNIFFEQFKKSCHVSAYRIGHFAWNVPRINRW